MDSRPPEYWYIHDEFIETREIRRVTVTLLLVHETRGCHRSVADNASSHFQRSDPRNSTFHEIYSSLKRTISRESLRPPTRTIAVGKRTKRIEDQRSTLGCRYFTLQLRIARWRLGSLRQTFKQISRIVDKRDVAASRNTLVNLDS